MKKVLFLLIFLCFASPVLAQVTDLTGRGDPSGVVTANRGTVYRRIDCTSDCLWVKTTSDPSASELSIAGSNAQDTFRMYMKNDKLVVAVNRSGTVNYLTIPLDGSTTTFSWSTTAP